MHSMKESKGEISNLVEKRNYHILQHHGRAHLLNLRIEADFETALRLLILKLHASDFTFRSNQMYK